MVGEKYVIPPQLRVVRTLPDLGATQIGEMFLLISDHKIYVRLVDGWYETAALSAT